jgi:hypothetical protein
VEYRKERESVGEPRGQTFVLAVGHQSPDDHVREGGPAFTIVEKMGEEGALVEEQDPRS